MSASNVTNANIQLALARLGSTGALSSGAGQSLPTGEGVSFADVALQVASLQAQTLGSLMNSGAPSGAAGFAERLGDGGGSVLDRSCQLSV